MSERVVVNGARLRSARVSCGMTLRELANISGVPASTMRQLEVGLIQTMPVDRLEVLCRVLKIDIDKVKMDGEETDVADDAESDAEPVTWPPDDQSMYHLLTCSMDEFIGMMRERYGDWDEFAEWMEKRQWSATETNR